MDNNTQIEMGASDGIVKGLTTLGIVWHCLAFHKTKFTFHVEISLAFRIKFLAHVFDFIYMKKSLREVANMMLLCLLCGPIVCLAWRQFLFVQFVQVSTQNHLIGCFAQTFLHVKLSKLSTNNGIQVWGTFWTQNVWINKILIPLRRFKTISLAHKKRWIICSLRNAIYDFLAFYTWKF